MHKILILNDLHFGTSANLTYKPSVVRQVSSQAKETFEQIKPYLQSHKPNLIMQLGDTLKDTKDKQIDTQNSLEAISLVESLGFSTIHIQGNHEVDAFSTDEFQSILNKAQAKSNLFGSTQLGSTTLIWLDSQVDSENKGYLPTEQLNFLKEQLSQHQKCIVFSHYSLVPINATGSVYFEKYPQHMYYSNYKEALSLIVARQVPLCINAHVHLLSHQIKNGTHFITNPAFSENIAGEAYTENNPGVYSILEFDENKFIFSSYSHEYCFAKIQGDL